ncbi:fungal-specific transcription factor domain-containing protein [Sporodiniella umbellata]|nr:fungal-specific transcription factor domain-containing protein [Sporodiniella umbellata]
MLRNSKNFQNGAFHFNSRGYRSENPTNSLIVDPYDLPPPDLSKHLLDLYFDHFYPLIPLLHKKTFLVSLENEDPNKRPPLLLMNAIYAVASRVSPDIRVRANPDLADTAGDIFLERARRLLDEEWDDYKVSTVQSLILISSHQNGALKNIRGWLYSGLAFRMCQNLGLNRNCDSWNLSDEEKEERKRVFYCCFVIDRLSCAMHGRAPMIDERDFDAPYPSQIDEDDEQNTPTIMDNFHQLIKLCEILGDVLCQLYMVKGRRHLSVLSSPDSVISKIDRSLNSWMAKLPPSIQYRPPNTRTTEKLPPPKLEVCQTHMLFYTTLILLHRPFIPGPAQKMRTSVFPSASICTFAANKILDIVECLSAGDLLKNINSYTLYTMFTAGIIFINDASSSDPDFAFDAKLSINRVIKAMDEVETTWITSARHCNILGELAGLRDINLEDVEEGFDRQAIKKQTLCPPEALSIAVPNSPLAPLEDFKNPIDAQCSVEQRFPDYLTQYAQPPFINNSPTNQSIQSTPEYLMNNGFNNTSFNPIGTAFWDIPMSFDIDQWNSYFDNQKL